MFIGWLKGAGESPEDPPRGRLFPSKGRDGSRAHVELPDHLLE